MCIHSSRKTQTRATLKKFDLRSCKPERADRGKTRTAILIGNQTLTRAFLGLPPSLPFLFEAIRLAALLDFPPALPSLAAIHFLEPRKPSNKAGT